MVQELYKITMKQHKSWIKQVQERLRNSLIGAARGLCTVLKEFN